MAARRVAASAGELSAAAKEFALAHEADDVGIAAMDPLYVFKGYKIEEPWVIVLALAHNYERLKHVPSDESNGIGICDVGDQYARGMRSSYALANWIRARGYHVMGALWATSLWAADVLPKPDPAFQGKIGPNREQSAPAFPRRPSAPKGAPNVILILLDDICFGAHWRRADCATTASM